MKEPSLSSGSFPRVQTLVRNEAFHKALKRAQDALVKHPEYRNRKPVRKTKKQSPPTINRRRTKPCDKRPGKACKFELSVLEEYRGPPCKKEAWSKRGCEIYGECVRVKGTSTRSCDSCPDYYPNLGPWEGRSITRAKVFTRQVNTAATQYLKSIGEPNILRPRGIIISGGGKYLPSAYITSRAVRHQDVDIPVELWYNGAEEYDVRYEKALQPFNVRLVDASRVAPYRYLQKYAIKSFAVRHCDFEEVLHLDADSYPVDDLKKLWGHEAVFWHDFEHGDVWYHPELFHVKPVSPNAWEPGQYLVNRRKCWDILNLAYFYDQHSDYTWAYGFGDTGTWRAAWDYFGKSPTFFSERPEWAGLAYFQHGPDGKTPMFVHRCRDKFRVEDSVFYTRQNTEKNTYHEQLPLEKQCFEWLEELKRSL